jgi:hypothetical protein
MLRGKVFFDTDATADYKWGLSGITGDLRVTYKFIPPHSTTLTVQTDNALPTNVAVAGTSDTGGFVEFDGILTPNADGTLIYQWCQNTSDAATTSTLIGSYFEILQVPIIDIDELRLLEDGSSYRLLEDGSRRLTG